MLPLRCSLPTTQTVVTGVAEATVKGAYRDLYPELYRLVPKVYADQAAINMLPPPITRDG